MKPKTRTIRINVDDYPRLEALAVGFDTPAQVVSRLIDFYEKHHQKGERNGRKSKRKK